MFSQSVKLEKYIESLNNLYESFIVPVLDGKQQGSASFDCEATPLFFGTDTLARCDYNTYKSIKDLNNNRLTHLGDSVAYTYPEYESAAEPLNEIINILGKEADINSLGLSNHPVYYKRYKNYNGFMGWHTNYDYPGDRWYFVYNTDDNSSFFRLIDPNTDKMITKWEPKGWCLNHFVVGDRNKPLWHCVHTNTHRISFGIRNIASPLFKNYKWKNVVLRQ
jgi:hypothetical protein